MSFQFDEASLKRKIGEAVAKKSVEIPCPACKAKTSVDIVDIAHEKIVTCSGCGKTIQLHDKDSQFKKLLAGEY